jgi:hypothetical protein
MNNEKNIIFTSKSIWTPAMEKQATGRIFRKTQLEIKNENIKKNIEKKIRNF